MPNWCWTDIKIIGPKEEVIQLNDLLTKWMSTACNIKNDFGKGWLGNIADKAGLDWEKVRCRGAIYCHGPVEIAKNGKKATVYFGVETAWEPLHEVWHYVLDKYAPNCKYLYDAQEWGNEIWWTNDFTGKAFGAKTVCVDCLETNLELRAHLNLLEELNYFTKKEFVKWGRKIFWDNNLTFEKIIQKVEDYIEEYDKKKNTESLVNVHKAEFVEAW